MKIVFIVHYFPPLNSSGARRVLAFGKYLTLLGHQISVITTAKSNYDGQLTETMPGNLRVVELGADHSRQTDKASNVRNETGRPWMARVLVKTRRFLTKIFGQLIDHRIFFALRFYANNLPVEARTILSEADVLVSSSPPWPVHLAAYLAAGKFNKPWLADYRDQFSGHHIFLSNAFSEYLERQLERLMLSRAARVVVVSSPMAEYYRQFHPKVDVIENGFDAEVFAQFKSDLLSIKNAAGTKKIVRYVGTVTKSTITKDRIPSLLQALQLLRPDDREKILVQFYGDSGSLPMVAQSQYPELIGCLEFNEGVSHREALRLILTADAVYFSGTSTDDSHSSRGVLTTKLFEYLAAGRPIVADIAPETLAGKMIVDSGLGLVCSEEPRDIAGALQRLVTGDFALTPNTKFIDTFSREAQAKRMEQVLQDVITKNPLCI